MKPSGHESPFRQLAQSVSATTFEQEPDTWWSNRQTVLQLGRESETQSNMGWAQRFKYEPGTF